MTLSSSYAQSLSLAGEYKGISSNNAKMTLLIRESSDRDSFNAILAEYEYPPFTDELAISVPRMYAFKITPTQKLFGYKTKSLMINEDNEIVVDQSSPEHTISISFRADGKIVPTLKFNEAISGEVTTFNIKSHSTWENYVYGVYTEGDVLDYFFDTETTMVLPKASTQKDVIQTATFSHDQLKGQFTIKESQNFPGMFVFTPQNKDSVGGPRISKSIGAFVDIVNWKKKENPKMTNELLLFSTENPEDVIIFYEKIERRNQLR